MKYIKIILPYKVKRSVLAFGAQSKGGFCFMKDNAAYLSEPFGDLSDLGNFKKFERQIKYFQKKLKIKPEVIACDLHPEYISTKYAYDWVKGMGWKVKKIQHHEAHIASCIVDNNIRGKVIGVAFDGSGFGPDNNIWGGEFFIGDLKGFKRVAHLRYIPMPGGEASIKEPFRMAFSYLYSIYGKRRCFARHRNNGGFAMTDGKTARNDIFGQMIDKRINSPLTSSMGRLFDGVSSLIGVCDFAKFEGEAAVKLEKITWAASRKPQVTSKYKFRYFNEDKMIIIDWEPVIRGIVKDLRRRVKKPEISLKFHNSISWMIKDVCNMLRGKYKIKKVCMSGGVFQNNYLSGRVGTILKKERFDVYGHKRIPTHDGGIALGQAVLANL